MPATRRNRSQLLPSDSHTHVQRQASSLHSKELNDASLEPRPLSPQKAKKLKLINDYSSASPYPSFTRPTHTECLAIFNLLVSKHPECKVTRRAPSKNTNSAETCGSAPDVIDSLVGTILSQNTSNKNSSGAKHSLDATFGRYNWEAVASAPRDKLVQALRSGGLANKKAAVIQQILKEVKQRHGQYSLQHLTSPMTTDEDVMKELQSYNGVGPKTASCVLLFCLGRDSFAVDTHVYRLSRLLGWIPKQADRVMAQAHLDAKVPGNLKYGLHVLLIYHGRRCSGCKNNPGKASCILKDWVRMHDTANEEEVEDRLTEGYTAGDSDVDGNEKN